MNKNTIYFTVFALIAFVLIGYFFIKNDTTSNILVSTASPEPTSLSFSTSQKFNLEVTDVDVIESKSILKTFEIEAGSYYFKPNQIKVNLGDTVKIKLNSNDMFHNIYIDEFDVKGPNTLGGNSSEVEFVVDKVGEFEFYCEVGNHKKMGQTGKLIVEPVNNQ